MKPHGAAIELISNHTVFDDLESQATFKTLLKQGTLPNENFSSVIHEATHHWCFVSPVGTALSMLYLSCSKRAMHWALTGDEAEFAEILDDLFVFQVANSWLKPLNEGLAQFAEYDVLPPIESDLISPPTRVTTALMFPELGKLDLDYGKDLVMRQVHRTITRNRLTHTGIERKAELLLQPMNVRKSPYLLGYLAVKQLWRHAGRFYPELKESDVFMIFLRKMVFGDYALVNTLLDTSMNGRQRAILFGQGVHQRLHNIRLMLFDDDVPWSEWEALLSKDIDAESDLWHNKADAAPFAALDTEEEVAQGLRLFADLYRSLVEPLGEEDAVNELAYAMYVNVLRERFLFWLGEEPARWKSTGEQKGEVHVGDERVLDMELKHASDEGLDELSLDFYLDLYGPYQLTTVENEKGVFGFAARSLGGEPDDKLIELKLNRQEIVSLTETIHSSVVAFKTGTNYDAYLESFWDEGAGELLQATYEGFATNNDDAFTTAIASGLDSIVEYDYDALLGLAAFSLGASANLSLDMTHALVQDHVDLRKVQANLKNPFKDFTLAELGENESLVTNL